MQRVYREHIPSEPAKIGKIRHEIALKNTPAAPKSPPDPGLGVVCTPSVGVGKVDTAGGPTSGYTAITGAVVQVVDALVQHN